MLLLVAAFLAPTVLADARAEARTYVWSPASARGQVGPVHDDTACDFGLGGVCFGILPGDAAVRVDVRETIDGEEIRDFTRGAFAFFADARGRSMGEATEVCGPTDLAIPEGAAKLYVNPQWVTDCRGIFYGEATGIVTTTGTVTATFSG